MPARLYCRSFDSDIREKKDILIKFLEPFQGGSEVRVNEDLLAVRASGSLYFQGTINMGYDLETLRLIL